MLNIMNRYVHGYVAIPVILACRERGVFKLLKQSAATVEQIVQQLSANEGYLRIALRMFESLNWVKLNNNGAYELLWDSKTADFVQNLPDKILKLYKIPIYNFFKKFSYRRILIKSINYLNATKNVSIPLKELLEGALIVPLFITIKQNYCSKEDNLNFLDKLPKSINKRILTLFIQKGWVQSLEKMHLTALGHFLIERAFNMAIAASYAPMFVKMDELLFGDSHRVFKKKGASHEQHIDRTLNVIASGFQHKKYFKDLELTIINIFNQLPIERQPNYIADMGCGDGTLLKHLYDCICKHSARGKFLKDYPVHMIGIDYNEKALIETEKNLAGIPHLLLKGDIGDPQQLIADLERNGINSADILHVRSFLDHDRPYISPKNVEQETLRLSLPYEGAYVDSTGRVILAGTLVQSLTEHLERWSNIISKHGLLVLEVHCLKPAVISKFIDESDSFHFDAYHAFSGQYLVEAVVFLFAAAEVGLFPNLQFSGCSPQLLPYTRITFNYFEKRPYKLRYAQLTDLPDLLRLEAECWSDIVCASAAQIERRLELFPQGQIVVVLDEKIVGVLYTQLIEDIAILHHTTYQQLSDCHSANGTILQLISINIQQNMQDQGLGDQLLDFVLYWSSLENEIDKIVGITRCKNYKSYSHLSLQDYIDLHNAHPHGLDPILHFHTYRGAKVAKILAGYRPEDIDNQGTGILIEYDCVEVKQNLLAKKQLPAAVIDRVSATDKTFMPLLQTCLNQLLPALTMTSITATQSLRELGLDSLGLLQFKFLLNKKLNTNLDATFFFRCPTLAAIANYLKENFSEQQQVTQPIQATETIAKAAMFSNSNLHEESIAIIGMSCRFPGGANHPEAYWQLLVNGTDAITEVPSMRWDWKAYANSEDDWQLRWGGFIDDVDKFDASFFNITPKEAEQMDPQQRFLLELSWEALEQAGVDPKSLVGTATGVFVGMFSHDYQQLLLKKKATNALDAHFATGNAAAMAAGRLAYFFGLQGPALTINTACSSSLVAVHLACQSLRLQESSLAIVGGVNLLLSPELSVSFSQAGMLAPDGHCKTFDACADGYVRGEGCGVIVLKSLNKAIADKDNILAVLRSSTVNQDGASNGLTAPNLIAQEQLLQKALQQAQLAPKDIMYHEAHGTGTKLGDPIEIKAITSIYGKTRTPETPLIVGSVKANIGHLEAAAGIAGLLKIVLALQHELIPKQIYFSELNPHIDTQGLIEIPMHAKPWHRQPSQKRYASVSSFGFSGTNANVIIEECPEQSLLTVQNKPCYLFTLSAKHPSVLKQRIYDLNQWIKQHPQAPVEALAYTLNLGRSHFIHRCALIACSLEQLHEKLEQLQVDFNNEIDACFISKSEEEFKDKALYDEILINITAKLTQSLLTDSKQYAKCLEALGNLYVKGYDLDWNLLHQKESQQKLRLPTYPFQRKRYWVSALASQPTQIQEPVLSNKDNDVVCKQEKKLIHYAFNEAGLLIRTEEFLKKIFAEVTKLSPEEIETDKLFESYGIDSLMIVNLNRLLESIFGSDVSKTLFFEHRTLHALANYFIAHHAEILRQQLTAENIPSNIDVNLLTSSAQVQSRENPSLQLESVKLNTISNSMMGYNQDIAIIGMSGQYPDAPDIATFWENLKSGKDSVTEIPKERWDSHIYFDTDKDKLGKSYGKWGGFIKDIDKFDPLFFNISPHEAEMMAPEERLFLQTAWSLIEDAGYTKESLENKRVGVYVGVTYNHYQLHAVEESLKGITPVAHTLPASIANRVSYFLDLHGPSISLDTMCSSSLVTIHLACKSIQNGECQLALVGGVNTSIHPYKYIMLSQGSYLSTDGRCKSFSEGGDGYVPAEGVGAILLKPLQEALKDNDHIYGVIKGSSVNHGGKTHGFTVPNPTAQASLIEEALNNANVQPDTISYIEAHGTGTALGDPIEISGLNKIFGKKESKTFCAIGSVKSNIGHCEAAAGIAGLTKVLLQMQHKTLVPSIHADQLNPNINWANTPFKVQRELTEWKQPIRYENDVAYEIPRRAGISSFGAGGTNAHIIVEEAPQINNAKQQRLKPYYLVTLSAKTIESLQRQVAALEQWLIKKQSSSLSENNLLENISYTLNTGRTHFNKRCTLVVNSFSELQLTLQQINTGSQPANYLMGSIIEKKHRETIITEQVTKLLNDISDNQLLNPDEYRLKLQSIGNTYIKGYEIDWNRLHQSEAKRKIPLPTYPFTKQRFWLTDSQMIQKKEQTFPIAKLHPLLDSNISILNTTCYQKQFSGKEFYLLDHKINSIAMLPGAAYLEMARAAAALAVPLQKVIRLSDIIWAKPIWITDKTITATIRLQQGEAGIIYEVVTESTDDQSEPDIHTQGKIIYSSQNTIAEPGTLDIGLITQRCTLTESKEIFYDSLKLQGFYYGPSCQTISQINYNQREVLAKIELPEHLKESADQFGLHPCLLDGVLQTALVLLKDQQTYLPFSIAQLDIFSDLPQVCYVHTEIISELQTNNILRFHIHVIDECGKVIIQINKFIVRVLQTHRSKTESTAYYYQPAWIPASLGMNQIKHDDFIDPILIVDDDESFANAMQMRFPQKNIVIIKSGEKFQIINERLYQINKDISADYSSVLAHFAEQQIVFKQIIYKTNLSNSLALASTFIDSQLKECFYGFFNLCQAFLQKKFKENIQICFINDAAAGQRSLLVDALAGFMKSLRLENPKFICQVLQIPQPAEKIEFILQELQANDLEVYYDQSSTRWIKQYNEAQVKHENAFNTLKKQGVYLITGGMGGLGSIFADYLAKNYQAKLILIGRSTLSEKQLAFINTLERAGSEVIYLQADVANRDSLAKALQQAAHHFNALNGIIHTAGLIRDAFIIKKRPQDIAEVFAPKIQGTIYLDELTQTQPLDFFLMFSSIASVYGNLGQSDYAFANGFMDAFAEFRQTLQMQNLRQGKSIVINWPLWAEGGMQIDETSEKWMQQTLGLYKLSSSEGIKAFLTALSQENTQQIVLVGQEIKFKQALDDTIKFTLNRNPKNSDASLPIVTNLNREQLQQQTEIYLKKLIAENIKLPWEKIQSHELFESYGIDSIMIMKLNRQLDLSFNDLPKTLFFEYLTVNDLASYFVENHLEILSIKFGEEKTPSLKLNADNMNTYKVANTVISEQQIYVTNQSSQFALSKLSQEKDKDISMDQHEIAIIGLSGQYPQAENLEIFWENLKTGKDSVTEIPINRWDYRDYFDSDKNKPGKSYSKWGAFIDDFDKFDPSFFNITPREAELIDPQERLFLQVAYKTFEDAGYAREKVRGMKVGVFVGAMYGSYQLFGVEESVKGNVIATNSVYANIANRVSYYFDFHGPSIALDTMCSSSLTTIHLACESIRHRHCQMALAGGVNLSIHPNKYILLSQGKFLSSDGRCRSFGEGGDGYVPGEGIGAILLKPLSQALADGDHIYGIVKGSSINHGGKTNGFTVPNPVAQAALIDEALKDARIDATSISYIESHGTGTSLGDPIEIAGLSRVFGREKREAPYAIGSVKSNIGHCESAAGIAAVTKVLLQLQHQTLVPSIHSEQLNSNINWASIPFKVQQQLTEWQRPMVYENDILKEVPRRAGISSFGAGGSNSHIIIEEAPAQSAYSRQPTKPAYILTLSAKTNDILRQKLYDLANWLENKVDKTSSNNFNLEDISFTLNTGRSHFQHRCALVVQSLTELRDCLQQFMVGRMLPQLLINSSESDTLFDQAIFKELFKHLMEDITKPMQLSTIEYCDKLLALANYYIKGYELDWEKLHQGETNRKISLPGYPFAKERYWIPLTAAKAQPIDNAIEKNVPASIKHEVNKDENIPEILSSLSPSFKLTHFELILNFLKQVVADKTKLNPLKINPVANFEDFGIDSIIITQMNEALQKSFGKLPATLFFKYQNLQDLANYFIDNHAEAVNNLLSHEKSAAVNNFTSLKASIISEPLTDKSSQANSSNSFFDGQSNDIAIIGISGQFPLAKNIEEYWENLRAGRNCITEIPEERWDNKKYFEPLKDKLQIKRGKIYCNWGGFIDEVDKFDASFFNISPRDAVFMDPQERLFMQSVWSCLESAGYTRQNLVVNGGSLINSSARVGVFAGVTFNNYQLICAEATQRHEDALIVDSQIFSVANRVSHYFNFKGPSITVDTACSSSLYALHLACESIKNGECTLAVAGGANLTLHPSKYATLCAYGFAASDGLCHSFGEGGDGYVPGEGVGAVLLKPLTLAVQDGDSIYGVIKASAVSHDGKTRGYYVPNPVAQSEAIDLTHKKSGIHPRTISYVEAHGTGTALGDPIEITGLADVYEKSTSDKQYCAIGSVKSNIGHLEAAAGIAQLIKVILQMNNKMLLPNLLHSRKINPNIDFANSPFYVQQELAAWERPEIVENNERKIVPRRAGISSFGAGGTNVHAIIEEYQSEKYFQPHYDEAYEAIIPLSAKTELQLKENAQQLTEFLQKYKHKNPVTGVPVTLQDLAYTLQVGREAMPYRLAFSAMNVDEVIHKLSAYINKNTHSANNNIYFAKAITEYSSSLSQVNNEVTLSLQKYAQLWVEGAWADWDQFYLAKKYKRIYLPTYAFAKERHWVTPAIKTNNLADTSTPITPSIGTSNDFSAGNQFSIINTGIDLTAKLPTALDFVISLADAPENEQCEKIIEYCQRQVAKLLEYSSDQLPEAEKGFFELGIDSIQAAIMHKTTEEELGIKISETAIFNYPNIVKMAPYLLSLIPFQKLQQIQSVENISKITTAINVNTQEIKLDDLQLIKAEQLPDEIMEMSDKEVLESLKALLDSNEISLN
jgi:acyl transferase domain-containing protein